jgi:hypothetical protein
MPIGGILTPGLISLGHPLSFFEGEGGKCADYEV